MNHPARVAGLLILRSAVNGLHGEGRAAGLTVVSVFRDDAISGARHDRPAYRQMLQAAEAKHFDTLLLWKQSRSGRRRVEVSGQIPPRACHCLFRTFRRRIVGAPLESIMQASRYAEEGSLGDP